MRSTNLQHLLICAALAIAALTFSSNAAAKIVNWEAHLDGSQEVPPVDTAGTGVAQGTLDTETNELSWKVEFKGLTGPATGAHFHGPAAPGKNAGVLIDIGKISGLESPMVGSTIITEEHEGFLLEGLLYINIHSAKFPGGEIRGQVNVLSDPRSMEGTVWNALILVFDSGSGDFLGWFTDVFRFKDGIFTVDGLGSAPYTETIGIQFTMWRSTITDGSDQWKFFGRRRGDGNLTFGNVESTVGLSFKFIAVQASGPTESSATAADWGASQ